MSMCREEPCIRSLLRDLMEILHKEIDQYRKLMALLQVQREYMLAYDIDSSAEMGKRQENVILSIKMLEEGRKAVVSQISQYFGVPSDLMTLKRLMTLLDNSSTQKCALYRSKMLSLIKRLESLNSIIAGPIQEELHYINSILRSFMSANPAA